MPGKVITVTPAGRKAYLEILAPYLLQNREHIQEHHFWVNTTDPQDIAYLEALVVKHPDFFKLNRRSFYETARPNNSIWQYFQDYTDDDTIYIRLDDDICYIAPDAISNLAAYRAAHPEPFLILGNIINNAICSYVQQQRGLVPLSWGRVENVCADRVGWNSKRFAARLHTLFLQDIRSGKTARWKFPPEVLDDYRRFSINVICWTGRDMQQVPERFEPDLLQHPLTHPINGWAIGDEERTLTEYLPAKFARPNVICGDALFSHFAYYTQRAYLEGMTTLLEDYHDLIDPAFAQAQRLRRPFQRVLRPLTAVRSPRAWKYLQRITRERILTMRVQ